MIFTEYSVKLHVTLCFKGIKMGSDKKTYLVKSIEQSTSTYLSTEIWQTADILDDFHYPWRDDTPPSTCFRALHADQYFHFLFEVEDEDLIADTITDGKRAVLKSDRVEIFFRKDEKMQPYYCLEMDYLGRVLDYEAYFYRKTDFDWNWPEGFHFRSRLTAKGYTVEGQISKASLIRLGLLQGEQLEAGLFRAEFKNGPSEVRWISWVHPETPKPDFHVPTSFGVLKLT